MVLANPTLNESFLGSSVKICELGYEVPMVPPCSLETLILPLFLSILRTFNFSVLMPMISFGLILGKSKIPDT